MSNVLFLDLAPGTLRIDPPPTSTGYVKLTFVQPAEYNGETFVREAEVFEVWLSKANAKLMTDGLTVIYDSELGKMVL